MIDITQLWPLVGLPVLRSVLGWAENVLEDGQISVLEWKLLASTVLRVGSIAGMGYFGLTGFGLDVDIFAVSAGAFVVDWIISKMRPKAIEYE